MKHLFSAALAAITLSISAPASADVLSTLQGATLADIRQAEAIYAANPQVPTAQAAGQCLAWADAVLSAPTAPITLNLAVPKGIVSTIADLDVALSTPLGVPPALEAFNKNCGWYVEDLKAQAAAHAGGLGIKVFGLHL